MRVTLHVISGQTTGQRIHLYSGQVGRFGRTEWSDFSFSEDETLDEVHFAVQCAPTGPRLRDLQSQTGTRLNGQTVTDAEIRAGDEIAAGAMRFLVKIEGASATPAEADGRPAAGDEADVDSQMVTAATICENVELEEEGRALLADEQTPDEFAALLSKNKLYRDAVRFAAARLPVPGSVSWGCQCARDFFGKNLPNEDQAAIEFAERWLAEPNEHTRREAERAAEANGYQTPGGWLAAAVFFSGGSLAPPEAEVVPPGEHLAATAVAAALLLTAAQAPPLQVETVLRNFLDRAECD